MPSKPHIPNFSPLGLMGLAHESRLERFFNIYNINLLEFEYFGFSSPSARGAALKKTMEFHHPLDFS